MTDQEIKEKLELRVEALEKERKANFGKWIGEMEQHPRCALLPSPEKLDEWIGSPGSDRTDTLRDFGLVKEWVTKSKLLNAGFYPSAGTVGENIEVDEYYSFIRLAFSSAFDAMRNTYSPELEELVFWYYAGHGLSKGAAQDLSYSSTPNLTGRCKLITSDYHAAANQFVMEGRKVQGGELCLHEVGFCDLYGLLKPWIAAVKAKSINAKGSKKNKHLVIILDSCYSGIIAEDLKDFEDYMKKEDSTFLEENSVTIQAACGPNEGALGGYFTPCFVYLNDPEKAELLKELKTEWNGMTEEKKNKYKSLEFPSPKVVSTSPQDGDITWELKVQNFNLTLFQDPGFFKFCSMKVYQHQDKSLFDGKDRVLNNNSAEEFMKNQLFNLLDYKLKTYQGNGPGDPNANTPMGMFLLKDHCKVGYTVCAHIHFDKHLTAKRINLVHHLKPPAGSLDYLHKEDYGKLTPSQISSNWHKVPVPLDENAQVLVQACRNYVESNKPGSWKDVSQWKMKGKGVNRLFRVQEQQKQRSKWECNYLEHIKKLDIPKVNSVAEQ